MCFVKFANGALFCNGGNGESLNFSVVVARAEDEGGFFLLMSLTIDRFENRRTTW